MKAWSLQVAFFALLALCCASMNASAQDAGMSDIEIPAVEVSSDNNTVFVPGEEAKFVPRASGYNTLRDSVSLQMQDFPMQRAAQRPAEKSADKQSKGKDESVLTFNFLYYIIQKYKLQDIID